VRVHATPQLRIIGVRPLKAYSTSMLHIRPGEGDNNIISLIRRRTTVLRVTSILEFLELVGRTSARDRKRSIRRRTNHQCLAQHFARPQIQIDREQTITH